MAEIQVEEALTDRPLSIRQEATIQGLLQLIAKTARVVPGLGRP